MDDESHLVQFQVYKASPTRVCMYVHLWITRDGELK